MQNKHIIVAIILVFLNMSFNCLIGPIKKNVAKREAILPTVYIIANLDAFDLSPKKNKSIVKIEIRNPRRKQVIKPHIRYLTGNEGQAVSFVKIFCAASDFTRFSSIF